MRYQSIEANYKLTTLTTKNTIDTEANLEGLLFLWYNEIALKKGESMKLEKEIGRRITINFEKLKAYGFMREGKQYRYSKILMDNFRLDILIDENQAVISKVYDTNFDEEYIPFHMENQTGEFVNHMREEYQQVLQDIVEQCGEKRYFLNDQSNRITAFISSYYNDEPEFAWESSPGFGIFRNSNNQKWYGLIMNIDKSKLDPKGQGEIEAINVKLDSQKILDLLKKPGFYPAYHMNKKHWVSIILDDTLMDKEIIECIQESHRYTE